MTDMFNHGLSETVMCDICIDTVEVAYFIFLCYKYDSCKIHFYKY